MTRNTPPEDTDQLAMVAKELPSGKWLANAQARSRRRKSAWNLLLPLFGFPLWIAFSFGLVWGAFLLHVYLTNSVQTARHFFGGAFHFSDALILMPSMVAGIGPAFLLTNFLVYLIRSARIALDAEDRPTPELGYSASQAALLKFSCMSLLICAPLIALGALL